MVNEAGPLFACGTFHFLHSSLEVTIEAAVALVHVGKILASYYHRFLAGITGK